MNLASDFRIRMQHYKMTEVDMDFSEQKQIIKKFYADLDAASKQDLPTILEQYCGADYFWRGFHPFN